MVDDSKDIRELLRVQLMQLGCRVVEAADGRYVAEHLGMVELSCSNGT
jgi:CheY-like chemotaxis protein